jgi:hypothetical protein
MLLYIAYTAKTGNKAQHSSVYKRVVRQCKKPDPQMAHLVFPTHEPTLKKPKEPFFANARQNVENNLK